MATRLYLALALHNHQPVGNFDHVFEQAYRQAYEPMVAALERHPHVRLALHYSGPLHDWLLAHHPDFFGRVRALVARGQVEIMTGAYYEPILAIIPDDDKHDQIVKQTLAVERDFGYRATGYWLAERVWEPHLVRPLAEAGVLYTIVDDTHFKAVGLNEDHLFGYYVSEEQGRVLRIFATAKHLRYTIPWAPVEEVIAWLRSQATEDGPRVAVMGDDGEKFGLWPGTYAHCWEKGWVDDFFSALAREKEWLITIPPGEYIRDFPPLGRVYLPTASYDEMTEWALPPALSAELADLKHRLAAEGRTDLLRFLRGGFWRNFLVKYPEVNTLHKKMLLVHDKVRSLGSGPVVAQALDELWMGQCNCPFWHGVFGGVYLVHIRTANFQHLLRAENLADQERFGPDPWLEVDVRDFDADTRPEVLVHGTVQNLYLTPSEGGALFEWDWRAKEHNLLNVMTRRPEGYHQVLRRAIERGEVVTPDMASAVETIHTPRVRVKEPGLEKHLHYDWYRRLSLLDHFLPIGARFEDFRRCQYPELGDFVNQPYTFEVLSTPESVEVVLRRDGHVWMGPHFQPLRVEKRLIVPRGEPRVRVRYRLTNPGDRPVEALFGSEWNWALLSGHAPDAFYLLPGGERAFFDSQLERPGLGGLDLVHEGLGWQIRWRFGSPATLWAFPLETISASEAGFERTYQGSCTTVLWTIALAPGGHWGGEMEITLLTR